MRWFWLLLVFLNVSCVEAIGAGDNSSTAEERSWAPPPPGCETVSIEPINSVAAVTSAGFRAADVLEFVEGVHTESIYWPDASFNVGPEQGVHQITLRVSYRGDGIELIKREPEYSEQFAMVSDCPDQMTIPVQVRLETDGGALAEDFTTDLNVKSRLSASIKAELELDSLAGDLVVSPSRPNCEIRPSITINSTFTPYGISGLIGFHSECDQDNGASSMTAFSADWPAESRFSHLMSGPKCDYDEQRVTLDSAWGSFSPVDAISLVNDTEGLTLTSEDGINTAVTLSFEAEYEEACLVLITQEVTGVTDYTLAGTYRVSGVVTVGNPDNGFDVSYDTNWFSAAPDSEGQLDRVTIYFHIPSSDLNALLSQRSTEGAYEMLATIDFSTTENGSDVSGEIKSLLHPVDQTNQQEPATYIWNN